MRNNCTAAIFWLTCFILESQLDLYSLTNKSINAKERYIKNVDSLVEAIHLNTMRTHFFLLLLIPTLRKLSNYKPFEEKKKKKKFLHKN